MNAPMQSLQALRNPAPAEANMPAVRAGFFDLQSFELIQRVSKAFAQSDLVPKQYQGNLANCMIAMDMAQRIGANPLMVMQNLYVVHGTPGWSSKFLIATINVCGRYSSLRYEWRGNPGDTEYGCRAWAIEKDSGERLDGIWVDWKMVRAEGWDAKNGSKWKTMPDQMFVYRAAAFWQRAYAPELGMGLQTAEELHDVYEAQPGANGTFSVDVAALKEGGTQSASTVVDGSTGEILETNSTSESAEASSAQASQGDGGAAPQNPSGAPTFEDAMAAVKSGDHDMAADIARSLPDGQRQQIETSIANAKAQADGAQQAGGTKSRRTSSGQQQMNME